MLIREVDKSLDMRLILRLRQNTELFNASSEIEVPIPVFIYDIEDKVFMRTYFPKNRKIRNLDLIIKKFEAVELEDSFVTTTRINNVKDLAIVRKLLLLPSVMLNRADMSKGFLNLYIRFHSSILEKISALLSEYTVDTANSRIELLGPSPGLMEIMDLINSQYPVSLITYEIEVPENDENLAPMLQLNAVAEVKISTTGSGGFLAVIYTRDVKGKQLPKGMEELSVQDGLYSFTISNDILRTIREESTKSHIVRMRFFVKPGDGKLQVTVFLPSNQVYEYYSIIFNVARASNNVVRIKHILPYGRDVWDFL